MATSYAAIARASGNPLTGFDEKATALLRIDNPLAPPGLLLEIDTSGVTQSRVRHPSHYLISTLRKWDRTGQISHMTCLSGTVYVVLSDIRHCERVRAYANTTLRDLERPPPTILRIKITNTHLIGARSLRGALSMFGAVSFLRMNCTKGKEGEARSPEYGASAVAILRVHDGKMLPGTLTLLVKNNQVHMSVTLLPLNMADADAKAAGEAKEAADAKSAASHPQPAPVQPLSDAGAAPDASAAFAPEVASLAATSVVSGPAALPDVISAGSAAAAPAPTTAALHEEGGSEATPAASVAADNGAVQSEAACHAAAAPASESGFQTVLARKRVRSPTPRPSPTVPPSSPSSPPMEPSRLNRFGGLEDEDEDPVDYDGVLGGEEVSDSPSYDPGEGGPPFKRRNSASSPEVKVAVPASTATNPLTAGRKPGRHKPRRSNSARRPDHNAPLISSPPQRSDWVRDKRGLKQ